MTTQAFGTRLSGRVNAVPPEVWVALIMTVLQLIQGCKDTPEEALAYLQEAKGNLRKRVVVKAMVWRAWKQHGLPPRKINDGVEALIEEADFLRPADVRRMYKEADSGR